MRSLFLFASISPDTPVLKIVPVCVNQTNENENYCSYMCRSASYAYSLRYYISVHIQGKRVCVATVPAMSTGLSVIFTVCG